MNKIKALLLFLLVLISLLVLSKDDTQEIASTALKKDATILAFGDSLTYGKGAPSQSYPVQLESLMQVKVINAGLSGEPASKGLRRLPQFLKQYKPELVILCHGGNDLIQQKSKEVLKAHLKQMIQLSKDSGAQVLLVGVPNFKVIRFSTESLYKDVAEEEGVMYEGEVLAQIENDTALKSDRIHPNAKGYGLMAEAFAKVLKDNGVL